MKVKTKISYFAMSAEFGDGGKYRFRLDRAWDATNLRRLVVIGLNPSTADETVDDPTIRRCIGFAQREGCGGLIMVNLFAYRATDPSELRKAVDPAGDGNSITVLQACQTPGAIALAAWGVHGAYLNRGSKLRAFLLRSGIQLHHLGLTAGGFPKHPLYLPATAPLSKWE
jgi:hypothetical protein